MSELLMSLIPPVSEGRDDYILPLERERGDSRSGLHTAGPIRLGSAPASAPGTLQARQRTAPPRLKAGAAECDAALDALIDRILAASEDTEEGESPPTTRAQSILAGLLTIALRAVEVPLPRGVVYADGDGGLRAEWAQGDRQIRLSINASLPEYDYLYYQDGKRYDIETPVTPSSLAGWFRWLQDEAA